MTSGADNRADPSGSAVNQEFDSCEDQEDWHNLCPREHRHLKKSLSHTGVSWESHNYYAQQNLHVPEEDKLVCDNVDNGNHCDSTALTNLNLGTAVDSTEALCQHVEFMEFQSGSAYLKRPRYNNNNNGSVEIEHMEYSGNKPQGEATTRVRQQEIPTISAEEWGESRSTGGATSEMDQQSSHSSLAKGDDSNPVIRRRHKKAISRSRSDLTKRCSNSSDLSELSARFSRNSADLEKFFNEMGPGQKCT